DSKKLAETPETAHETVPNVAIHPDGDTSTNRSECDDGPIVKFVQPHFVFQGRKHRRLHVLERIGLCWTTSILRAGTAIHQDTKPDADRDKHERHEKHRLDQSRDIKLRRFASEITVQPWPRRREHDA